MSRPPYGTGIVAGSIIGLLLWAGLLMGAWRAAKFFLGLPE